jgi:hypothetical protein
MTELKKVILFTDTDGRARFREEWVSLTEGTPQSQLSALMAASACQLRQSPVGFRSSFHCTGNPQWLFVLGGQMEIFLQDGSSRTFGPGEFFTRLIPCLKGPRLTLLCTATGAAKSAPIRW